MTKKQPSNEREKLLEFLNKFAEKFSGNPVALQFFDGVLDTMFANMSDEEIEKMLSEVRKILNENGEINKNVFD